MIFVIHSGRGFGKEALREELIAYLSADKAAAEQNNAPQCADIGK